MISLIVCDDVAWFVMLTIFDVDSDTSFGLGHALYQWHMCESKRINEIDCGLLTWWSG